MSLRKDLFFRYIVENILNGDDKHLAQIARDFIINEFFDGEEDVLYFYAEDDGISKPDTLAILDIDEAELERKLELLGVKNG